MMKDNRNFNSEFEELLKGKMNELADSVDCFDKITKRAYPRQDADFADGELTVCELENVTGKKNFFRFMPAVAIMAACALCLFFLPKNGSFVEFVSSYFGKSDEKAYREIINEIKEETASFNYETYDCPLDEYISNDVVITPLFSCPFEKSGEDELSVRIFVKMCGSIPTNQVYAVVYEGNYNDGDYIAAAESSAKFTEKEISELAENVTTDSLSFTDLRVENELIGKNGSNLTDIDGNDITLAGFDFNCFYKQNDKTSFIMGNLAYYTINNANSNTHYYDVFACSNYNGSQFESFDIFEPSEIYDPAVMWANVLYFNGESARADSELSDFVNKKLFSENGVTALPFYMSPYNNSSEYAYNTYRNTSITVECNHGSAGSVKAPVFENITERFRVYVPDATETFICTSSDGRLNHKFDHVSSGSTEDSDKTAIENIFINAEEESENYNSEIARIEEELKNASDEQQRMKLEAEINAALMKEEQTLQRLADLQKELDSLVSSDTEYDGTYTIGEN